MKIGCSRTVVTLIVLYFLSLADLGGCRGVLARLAYNTHNGAVEWRDYGGRPKNLMGVLQPKSQPIVMAIRLELLPRLGRGGPVQPKRGL